MQPRLSSGVDLVQNRVVPAIVETALTIGKMGTMMMMMMRMKEIMMMMMMMMMMVMMMMGMMMMMMIELQVKKNIIRRFPSCV